MRSALWVAGLGLLLGACGLRDAGREAQEERAVAEAESHRVEPPQEFAVGLHIDLDAMRRTASGLYIQDLKEGQGLGARRGHVLSVHYTGWLPNGQQFDSSRERGVPFVFQLGASQVIRGWEEGIQGMRIGGVRRLVVPPGLAYGARGVPGAIPPNATLVFEVELLDIKM